MSGLIVARPNRASLPLAALMAVLLGAVAPGIGTARGLFGHGTAAVSTPTPAAKNTEAVALQVRQALDERRFVDAGDMLDATVAAGAKSPELDLLSGELMLAKGNFKDALQILQPVESVASLRAGALEGEGLAYSMLGRSEDAMNHLKQAIALDKSLWRAWNCLGREYDLRRDWAKAAQAYSAAMSAPGANIAIVLNNRGYSKLLQRLTAEAAADFVAALDKDPSLAAARTNLRLTLAMEGHYSRATAVGPADDRAAVLNNVGLAAALRGDYLQADTMLNQAIAARGQYYAKASENLQLSRDLATRREDTPDIADDPH